MALTEAEAKDIVRRIAKPTLEFASTIVAPLYWPAIDDHGQLTTRSGTAFFLRTETALFGVTAAHVIEGAFGWRRYCETRGKTALRLGAKHGNSVSFDWDARCVDISLDIDIATFAVSEREIEQIERAPYSGVQDEWPPEPPVVNQGIMYAGFPGVGTRQLSRREVVFGVVFGTGLVSAISETNISSLIERDYLEPITGEGLPPENFNFGGISGGPMLKVSMRGGLFVNALAGVVYSGPNTSTNPDEAIPGFELIRARPARFIRSDGFLEHNFWSSL